MFASVVPESPRALGRAIVDEAVALAGDVCAALAGRPRAELAVFILLVFGGAVLRLRFVDRSVRYDEALSYVYYARLPLRYGLTRYYNVNNHPLHTLSMHVATTLGGGSPEAMRVPALAAGVLVVPAAYAAVRCLHGPEAALVACAWTAVASPLVEYSVNARGYTLVVLFTMLATALACRLQARSPFGAWFLFAVTGALGAWTVPTAVLPFVGLVVWLPFRGGSSGDGVTVPQALGVGCLAGLLSVLLWSPIIATMGLRSVTHPHFIVPLALGDLPAAIGDLVPKLFAHWHRDVPGVVQVLMVAGFVVTRCRFRSSASSRPTPAGPMAVVALAFIAWTRAVPFERVWLPYLPLYLGAAAAGIVATVGSVGRRLVGSTFVAILAVALSLPGGWLVLTSRSIVTSPETGAFPAAAAVADVVARDVRGTDRALAVLPADMPLLYHLLRRGRPADVLLSDVSAPETLNQQTAALRPGTRILVVVAEPDQDVGGVLDAAGLTDRCSPPVLLRRLDGAALYGTVRRADR